jgi:hypothetical protein
VYDCACNIFIFMHYLCNVSRKSLGNTGSSLLVYSSDMAEIEHRLLFTKVRGGMQPAASVERMQDLHVSSWRITRNAIAKMSDR